MADRPPLSTSEKRKLKREDARLDKLDLKLKQATAEGRKDRVARVQRQSKGVLGASPLLRSIRAQQNLQTLQSGARVRGTPPSVRRKGPEPRIIGTTAGEANAITRGGPAAVDAFLNEQAAQLRKAGKL